MKSTRETVLAVISHIVRTLLGLTFIFSGAVKAIDPLGTTYKIEDYLTAFGEWFTNLLPMAQTGAFCLITIEFVLGVCLLLHIRTQWTAWLSLCFYLVMTPLTLYIALYNPVSDCGCFGDAILLTNRQTFWKNIILLTLTVILLLTKRYTPSLWVWQAEGLLAILSAGAVIGWMVWTLYHLPVLDFRPYKVGNHIPSLMEYPEDAEPDQYEITFTYAKDGVEQDFTLDNYPGNDSSWTFVRQNSHLVKKGYEPPIHDFEILNSDYEDITYDILDSEERVTLAVLYDLNKTDLSQLNRLVEIKQSCEQQGEAFYLLTGSGMDDITRFVSQPNAESLGDVICSCDPVTLKTIVRANPGIVILQNGTIIQKHNLRNL